MAKVIWTPKSELDLAELAYYIAVEDRRPATADGIIDELRAAAEKFADLPLVGHRHPDLGIAWLYRKYKRWLIFLSAD